jgi:cystathionine beta-lyase/cystathionine gamma-synthase
MICLLTFLPALAFAPGRVRYDEIERTPPVPAERLVRFNVGLETISDLIADLTSAWAVFR